LLSWLTDHWEPIAAYFGGILTLALKEWWQTRRETRLTTLKLSETTIAEKTRVEEKKLDVGLAHDRLTHEQVQALFNEIAKLYTLLGDQTSRHQLQLKAIVEEMQTVVEMHKKCEGDLAAARELIIAGNERILRLEGLEAQHAEQLAAQAARLAEFAAAALVREESFRKLEQSYSEVRAVNSDLATVLAKLRDEKQASVPIPKTAVPGGGDFPVVSGKRVLMVEDD
jgi:hypothetical protein